MLISQNGSNKDKCETSHHAPQKICHEETTETAVWNNYSGTWVLVWTQNICSTLIQIRGETELSHRKKTT